jgi:lipoprotein NlpD
VVAAYDDKTPLAQGIKITGKAGDSIRAAESGKVVYSGSGLIGYGRLIIVKHNDNYLSAYGHNREILVSEGDQVTKGQQIAKMGTAGDGGPLLHFEIRRNGKPVNPARYLPQR